ncbi:MAG: hypothetical protein K6E91_14780 [Butyrivibrio sp.]|nr:hypothetical protein [Butyrivibrio sp.]
MTTKELKKYFKEHMVPSKLYKIGGAHKNRICLDKSEGGWRVYFQDKKDKIGIMKFVDEASACNTMKDELRKLMEQLYGLTWAGAR